MNRMGKKELFNLLSDRYSKEVATFCIYRMKRPRSSKFPKKNVIDLIEKSMVERVPHDEVSEWL